MKIIRLAAQAVTCLALIAIVNQYFWPESLVGDGKELSSDGQINYHTPTVGPSRH